MARNKAYGTVMDEMASALARTVSRLGSDESIDRPALRDMMWLLEERYGALGIDDSYDDFVDAVTRTMADIAYGAGPDTLARDERNWMCSVADRDGDSPYGRFLAGRSVDDEDDDVEEPDAETSRRRSCSSWESSLTQGQRAAFEAVREGRNVFVTGNGGTGKSYLVNGIIDWAKASGLGIIVCAPTGIAALNVGGSTIHRTLGISPDKVLGPTSHPSIPVGSPLPKCDLMIVDEISMCRMDLFDYLSCCLREVGRERERLGLGLCQLVVVGDFFQLPPVVTDDDEPMLRKMYGRDVRGGYPFMGDEWSRWGFRRVLLTETIRQRDAEFVRALERCRVGDIAGARWIEEHASRTAPEDAIVLCGTNSMAGRENKTRLAALPSAPHGYVGTMWGDVRKSDMPTDMKIQVSPGARVMSVVNDPDGGYMNGSLGTVVSCGNDSVTVRFDDGVEAAVARHVWPITKPVVEKGRIRMQTVGEFSQIPLKLAWAITIHKSQGQTFDHAVIHPYCWDYGQLYTALSRLTDVSGMKLAKPIQTKYLKASPDVIEFERGFGDVSGVPSTS